MATTDTNCNCLSGTAVIDASGNCRCVDAEILPFIYETGSGKTIRRLPIQYDDPHAPPPLVDKYWLLPAFGAGQGGTIFGFPPLLVLGAVAIGVWMLSSKGEK